MIIITLVYFVVISKNKLRENPPLTNSDIPDKQVVSQIPAEVSPDLSIMTPVERKKFRIASSTKVEVLRRSATGTPTDYRIIK